MSYQINEVIKAKSKALKVFTDTKAKFEKAIAQAQAYVEKNREEVASKHNDILDLERANRLLEAEAKLMTKQVQQINAIVGAE